MINYSHVRVSMLLLIITFSLSVHSGSVPVETINEFCAQWVKSNMDARTVDSIKSINQKENTALYLVKLLPKGFMLVQRTSENFLIVGYSDIYRFDDTESNPLTNGLIEANPRRNQGKSRLAKITADEVAPMTTALFNQGDGWNRCCPKDAAAINGRTMVGCGGTAMAILLHYWKYPIKGRGTTDYIDTTTTYGKLSADFGKTVYQWDRMSATEPDTFNTLLLYHCALAIKTIFGPESSSDPSLADDPFALRTFFGFSKSLYGKRRSEMDDATWKNMIKKQITEGKPVFYFGSNASRSGHAFIIDGYKDELFHVNWGWGGNSNGYYSLDNLTFSTISYNMYQHAVFDAEPERLNPVENLNVIYDPDNKCVTLSWKYPSNDGMLKYFKQAYIKQDSRYNTKGPERATIFSLDDFPFSVPFTLSAVSHSFYIGEAVPDSTFNFIIYDSDGVTKLYTSPALKANLNNEIKHPLNQPLTVTNNFYVSVVQRDQTGTAGSNTTVVNKSDCHSVYGSSGSWNAFNYAAPGGRELHTTVFVNGKYKAGRYPEGGYIIYRNNSSIDTIESLETTSYKDKNITDGKRIYKVISYLDTSAFLSKTSDSVFLNLGTTTLCNNATTKDNYYIRYLNNQIVLRLHSNAQVKMDLFDLSGKRNAELCNQQFKSGKHTVMIADLKKRGLTKGMYLLRATIGSAQKVIAVMVGK